jgi:hypothetical protein
MAAEPCEQERREHERREHAKRTPRGSVASVLSALCLALLGCGASALNRGADFYTQGRYIDAAQVFEHTEADLAGYDGAERARYGYYRGATLLALGYTDDARHWLSYGGAFAVTSLSAGEREHLIATLVAHDRAARSGSPGRFDAAGSGISSQSRSGAGGSVPYLLTLLPASPAAASALPPSRSLR